MTTTARREAIAYVVLTMAGTAFAANVLTARAAADVMPPFALAFWRWLTLTVLVLPFAWRDLMAYRAAIRDRWTALFVLGAVGMGVCAVTLYFAGHTTNANNMALIATGTPILVMVGARVFLDERLTPVQIAGVVVALLGVVIIVVRGDPQILVHMRFTAGDLWAVASVFAWALYSVLLRRLGLSLPGLVLLATGAVSGAITLLPFVVWETFAVGTPPLSLGTVGLVLMLALVPSLLGYGLHSRATMVLGANRASLMSYITLVAVVVLSWLILDERLEPYHWAGGAAVIAGLWLSSRKGALA